MIEKITTILLAIVSALAIFFRIRVGQLESREQVRQEALREYERAGSEAMIEGIEKEHEVGHEEVDTSRRDYFE